MHWCTGDMCWKLVLCENWSNRETAKSSISSVLLGLCIWKQWMTIIVNWMSFRFFNRIYFFPLQVWDVGGQPRFRAMWERYCRGVDAIMWAIIVFIIVDIEWKLKLTNCCIHFLFHLGRYWVHKLLSPFLTRLHRYSGIHGYSLQLQVSNLWPS